MEQAQRDAQRLFQNVTDSSPTGLWLSNKDGMLTYFNKTLIDFTGLPYEELLAGKWTRVIAEDDFKRQKKPICMLSKTEHTLMYFSEPEKHRRTHLVQGCRRSFYNSEGDYDGYAGFCMDMDEIISGRKAVTESQYKVNAMIEQSPVGICLFTGYDMKIEIANDIMIGYWGKDRSVIGQPF